MDNSAYENSEALYEYCPRCDANLTLQKGYSSELPFWICKGCGEMLINPDVESNDDIAWICDGCGTMLNIQAGFADNDGEWKCTECGFINRIDEKELYRFEDEYEQSLKDPYKGLSDKEVLELSEFEDVELIGGRFDIILVRNSEDDSLYVKKFLKDYDLSIYQYLKENPVRNMPKITGIYEGSNNLVVIEEYIPGRTLSEVLTEKTFSQEQAVDIVISICRILQELHGGDHPIIHRDIKPSNIILTNDNEICLLDINVAKWFKANEVEDTRMYGTLYYAAPEQLGYGFSASSAQSDIYAVGILLNVLITGKLPKEEKSAGIIWDIIEKCISLEQEKRYTADELLTELGRIR